MRAQILFPDAAFWDRDRPDLGPKNQALHGRICMRMAIVASAMLAVFAVAPVHAQEGPASAEPRLTCPASGYAKPWYGMAGDNDGQLRGYEIASPCVGK